MPIFISGPNGNRSVPLGEVYRLEPGEKVTGSKREIRLDKIDHISEDTMVGTGDLIHALTTATGFKEWWRKHNKGSCLPCKRRQAALNYFEFKGPQWVHDWVESKKEKE